MTGRPKGSGKYLSRININLKKSVLEQIKMEVSDSLFYSSISDFIRQAINAEIMRCK